ncbi:MAG TPA: alpha,alpha-trehalase TreF [Ferruginibacter sp.]|nr:alpha,alpha-trehalase TreF [Ferruginibacter sp.]HPH92805.1 alpha,alpha-trehalase TreF [Ferruginibacter sp.]
MKRMFAVWMIALPLLLQAQLNNYPPTPDKIYGQLFIDVQMQQVFPDGKTFVDCTPKRKVADIMYQYGMMRGVRQHMQQFIENNFNLPPAPPQLNYIQHEKDIELHIKNLWAVLKRDADVSPRWEGNEVDGNSLLALPYPYVVPGGRFREIYYWDSYFTMLGLKASGEKLLLENMVKNFDYLITRFGHIPNGNRSYYLSRSQPPFFCMMVEMLAGIKGNSVYKKYLPSMLKEYAYWMAGADTLKKGAAVRHIIKLDDGSILNRYWDENYIPRQESYKQDTETADTAALELAMVIKVASEEQLKEILDRRRNETYRDLRAAAESGWDFSSRWFTDPAKLSSVQTTKIIPVDLNCLLYQLETTIAKALKQNRKTKQALQYTRKASARKKAILQYCWNAEKGFFFDYNYVMNQQSDIITAAGIFPLFVKIATPAQAVAVAKTIESTLLKDGGIVTTTNTTGQQWDAPNGWAPLQWIAVNGFKNYNRITLAKTIALRWLSLTEKVYANTGKLMEKYNVEDLSKEAGGGEYPAQDGFGWTNGVYLGLKKIFPGN